jgi:hypothetical protein
MMQSLLLGDEKKARAVYSVLPLKLLQAPEHCFVVRGGIRKLNVGVLQCRIEKVSPLLESIPGVTGVSLAWMRDEWHERLPFLVRHCMLNEVCLMFDACICVEGNLPPHWKEAV